VSCRRRADGRCGARQVLHVLLGEEADGALQRCGLRDAVRALVDGPCAAFWRQEVLLVRGERALGGRGSGQTRGR
jgi:hypothetical protein